MKITICGSMSHDKQMGEYAGQLARHGYEVERPNVVEGHVYEDNLDSIPELKQGFIDQHFAKISSSDAILVVNDTKNGIEGYIGGNTLLELGYAYSQGLEIFMINPVPDLAYADEIRGMQPIVIDGDVDNIDKHYSALPLLVVSSQSPVKHSALSRGLRKAGIRIRLEGLKVESGVNEQPFSIDETYEGALTRQDNLKNELKNRSDVTYIATIESGNHKIHDDHDTFGCSVFVLEKVGGDKKVGIDLDIEFPRSMTDMVPSVYPDIGVLVQKEFGATLKDPYPYITNGKLTRAMVLENAVYKLAIQFDAHDKV